MWVFPLDEEAAVAFEMQISVGLDRSGTSCAAAIVGISASARSAALAKATLCFWIFI